MSNVLKKAITLVSEVLELDLNEINPETSLMGEPAWDSLAHMRIILAIEGFIGHELLPERLVEIMSVADIARVIELEEASLSPVITPPVRPAIKKRPAKIRITNQTIPAHRSIQPKMRTIGRINQIDAKAWDACGGNENPFLSYGFLSSLEESKSVSPEKGFRICHLILEGPKGELLGGSPCYLRSHAYAGHSLDGNWIELYRRNKLPYFPKLQADIPYMPIPGGRLLVPPGPNQSRYKAILVRGLKTVANKSNASSIHITRAEAGDLRILTNAGFITSTSIQNVWKNQNYQHFDDFLMSLRQRKRTKIRSQRKKSIENGLSHIRVQGTDITPEMWKSFYAFHQATNKRYGTTTYLTEDFFLRLSDALKDRVLLTLAMIDNKPVAGTLHFIGKNFMFPRYWGSLEKTGFLHFECTYYQSIEFAIDHKLPCIDVGQDGEHKLERGFLPEISQGAHLFLNPQMHELVEKNLVQHEKRIIDEVERKRIHSPYI